MTTIDPFETPADDAAPAETCECGAWSGERCCGEIGTDAVTVEYMPEALRESHDAARNRGTYPANGAWSIRVTPACANQMASTDGEWCSVIAEAA